MKQKWCICGKEVSSMRKWRSGYRSTTDSLMILRFQKKKKSAHKVSLVVTVGECPLHLWAEPLCIEILCTLPSCRS